MSCNCYLSGSGDPLHFVLGENKLVRATIVSEDSVPFQIGDISVSLKDGRADVPADMSALGIEPVSETMYDVLFTLKPLELGTFTLVIAYVIGYETLIAEAVVIVKRRRRD